jgi:hypothetical protein
MYEKAGSELPFFFALYTISQPTSLLVSLLAGPDDAAAASAPPPAPAAAKKAPEPEPEPVVEDTSWMNEEELVKHNQKKDSVKRKNEGNDH